MQATAPISLSDRLEFRSGNLIFTYEVINHSHRDVYLINKLYRTSPDWDISPNVIYIKLELESEAVILSKKLADIPQYVSTPVAPFVTPLRAGQSFQEQVQIPLPIREYQQYSNRYSSAESKARGAVFKSLRFVLGYYWRPEGTTEDVREVHGSRITIPQTPPGQPIDFGELTTQHLGMNIPVMIP